MVIAGSPAEVLATLFDSAGRDSISQIGTIESRCGRVAHANNTLVAKKNAPALRLVADAPAPAKMRYSGYITGFCSRLAVAHSPQRRACVQNQL
jgi:hypothetical protein